jgi:general secretion pathway protein L
MNQRFGVFNFLFIIDGPRRFFSWWLGELRDLIPGSVRRFFRSRSDRILVNMLPDGVAIVLKRGDKCLPRNHVNGGDACYNEIQQAIKTAGRGDLEIVLRLSEEDVLRKTIELPLSAEANLRALIEFDLDRQTPFAPEDVYLDFLIVQRDMRARRIFVEFAIVPRKFVDQMVALMASWGVYINRVDQIADPGETFGFDFLPNLRCPPSALLFKRSGLLMSILAVILLVIVIGLEIERGRYVKLRLEEEIAEARSAAEVADTLQHEIEKTAARQRFLPTRRNTPRLVTVLNEIARLLPDDTWLSGLQLTGRQLRADGFSHSASSVIGLIDGSRFFTNAQFRSAVTQGPRRDIEHFDVSFETRPIVAP